MYSPKAPSQGKRKSVNSPTFSTRSRRGSAFGGVRRFNTLSTTLAHQLGYQELATRFEVASEEGIERANLLASIISLFMWEKIHIAVSQHLNATICSRNYIIHQEAEEWNALMRNHIGTLNGLRSRIQPAFIHKRLAETQEEEVLARHKALFVEQRTFEDLKRILNRFIFTYRPSKHRIAEAAEGGTEGHGDSVTDLATHSDQAFPTGRTKKSSHLCIRLYDGCPFVNPRDCPFYEVPWIEAESFKQQHLFRKYPPLKAPLATEALEQERLIARRQEQADRMNFRLYQRNLQYGLLQ